MVSSANTAGVSRTESLLARVRRSLIFRELIPAEAGIAWPVPVRRGDRALMQLAAFGQRARPGGGVDLYPPFATLTLEWSTARPVEYRDLRIERPETPNGPIGTFPHAAIRGTSAAYVAKRRELLGLYDELFERLATPAQHPTDALDARFCELLALLIEPPLEPYLRALAPDFLARVLGPAGKAPQAATDSPAAKAAHESPAAPLARPAIGPALDAARVGDWLRQVLALVSEHGLDDMLPDLKELYARLAQPAFRIALVGSRKNGKSHLANRLLGAQVVPTGAVTGAAMPVVITGVEAQRPSLELHRAGRAPELRMLTAAAWGDLLTDGDGDAAQTRVRVLGNFELLRSSGFELIDTPGLDSSARANDQAASVAANSDAVVLVTAATSALALSERSFVDEHVIDAHVPRVATVVTRWDLLSAGSLGPVLDRIKQIMHARLPESPVVLAPEFDREDAAREAALRDLLVDLVSGGERVVWRNRQITQRLVDLLGEIAEVARVAQSSRARDADERRREQRRLEAELGEQRQAWERAALELERRRVDLKGRVLGHLETASASFAERFVVDLERAPNPQAYWEREAPAAMRRDLRTLAAQLESTVLEQLARDIGWAEQAVGAGLRPARDAAGALAPVQFDRDELKLADVAATRAWSRLGIGAAGVAAAIVFTPVVGMLAVITAGVAGEEVAKAKLADQRTVLLRRLELATDTAIRAYADDVDARIAILYGNVLKELRRSQEQWYATARSVAAPAADEHRDWAALTERCTTLAETIATALREQA